MKYRCDVRFLDETGQEFRRVSNVVVEAKSKDEAWFKAKDEVWDDRLTAASCTASIHVVELP